MTPQPSECKYLLLQFTFLVGILGILSTSQVWFRKGLSRAKLNGEENVVTGSRWVEMVGKFSLIAVALNDQVSLCMKIYSMIDFIYS